MHHRFLWFSLRTLTAFWFPKRSQLANALCCASSQAMIFLKALQETWRLCEVSNVWTCTWMPTPPRPQPPLLWDGKRSVCIYMYIHISIDTHIPVHIYIYIYTFTYTYTYAYAFAYTCVYTYTCTYTYTRIYVYVYIYPYIVYHIIY